MDGIRSKLRYRAENKAESVCYTYKQHFAAANFYRALSRALDGLIFAAAALILATNFWGVISQYLHCSLQLSPDIGEVRICKTEQRSFDGRRVGITRCLMNTVTFSLLPLHQTK
jgi:hypothetical protein